MTGISASGALAYDAFQVLDAAFKKILKDKPFLFTNDNEIGKIVLISLPFVSCSWMILIKLSYSITVILHCTYLYVQSVCIFMIR